MNSVSILGAGTWGIAIAQMLSSYCNVTVWSAIESEIDNLSATHIHPNLKDVRLAESILFTKDISVACRNKYIVMAVPSVYVRSTAQTIYSYVDDTKIIIDVAKGLEKDTCLTMTGVIRDVLGEKCGNIVALTGPTHAEEVIKGMLTTIVSASENAENACTVQKLFTNDTMRVYTNPDTLGVEICGCIKNIIAIASGVSAGLGYGDNIRAALITRGCAEMTRLGIAMGCMPQTFYGLAGIGDLIVTASSMHSRNNRAGYYIGQGLTVDEAVKKVGMVVEGINAIKPVMQLAEKYGVEMPIVEGMNDVIYNGCDAKTTAKKIFSRELKSEVEKYPFDIAGIE
ncbi:MAG: NAD(P)-dependent glycerol-3-phosphate dehydrogenase [Ruminococcus flavefaciens]|nr:NAD(P)-dependent glycerol-3-phosphate dehydrogenase [Ruminococcus flavefaciens]